MPCPASKSLVPRKKDLPAEIYGGYNKTTASFFVLVRYCVAKKSDVIVMPVELLYANRFLNDSVFAEDYAKRTIGDIVNKPISNVEFLLNKRVIKVNTMLSLDGFRVCIAGKSSGGSKLLISSVNAFKTSPENEAYIKKLESFERKKKENAHIVWSEAHDGISAEKNLLLYDCYLAKWQCAPFQYRPAKPITALSEGRAKFISLAPDIQAGILLQIQGLFGRSTKADLSQIGGVSSAGVATLSSMLTNWKKNYTDVRIIDQSASGLFETVSENLLDLL